MKIAVLLALIVGTLSMYICTSMASDEVRMYESILRFDGTIKYEDALDADHEFLAWLASQHSESERERDLMAKEAVDRLFRIIVFLSLVIGALLGMLVYCVIQILTNRSSRPPSAAA